MFDYLQQFNKLPKDLRDRVSSPSAMAAISALEAQYKVDLAVVIMKVIVKSIPVATLPLYLSNEFSLSVDVAERLTRDLKEKIFSPIAEYLGLAREMAAFDQDKEIEKIIAAAGLNLPSSLAVGRFKNIISTYNRGIRNKIDTKNTLEKSYKIGGLDLSPEETERVLKICDNRLPQNSVKAAISPVSASPVAALPSSRLDKIVASADKANHAVEYDLKQALASGQTKKISAPEKELNLPLVSPVEALPAAATPLTPAPVADNKPVVAPVTHPTIAPVVHPVINHIVPPKTSPQVQNIKQAAPEKIAKPDSAPLKPIATSRPMPVSSGTKTIMRDVKPVPKVMGPIEELQFLDLLNFRRLGKTPAEITAKIFSKIKLLEAEGYDKMVSGVRAWRQSPVNRLYLKMGQEAIKKDITIKELASSYENDSKNYLSLEEIEEIIVMNSKLVF